MSDRKQPNPEEVLKVKLIDIHDDYITLEIRLRGENNWHSYLFNLYNKQSIIITDGQGLDVVPKAITCVSYPREKQHEQRSNP